MTDTGILITLAFTLIEEDFKGLIQEGPAYMLWNFAGMLLS